MPTRARSRIVAVAVAVVAVSGFGLEPAAHAGGGQIQADNDASGDFAQGRISGKIFVDLPRSQEQFDEMNEQLQAANKLICDYTNGLFRIERLTYVNHPAEKKNADIWWFDRSDRAVSDLGSFGQPGAQLNIYRIQEGQTIAHELGHLVFGINDSYRDSRARDQPHWRGGSISGLALVAEPETGANFFRPMTNPDLSFKDIVLPTGVPLVAGTANPLYTPGPGGEAWWQVNNSMMQQSSSSKCLSLIGLSADQVNPVLWNAQGCLSSKDENADLIHDDCGPHCVGGSDAGDACVSNSDCAGGFCNGGDARWSCVAPVSSEGRLCGLLPGGAADNAACDSAAGAGDGMCQVIGFPVCIPSLVVTSSELSAAGNHDLDRFNVFAGTLVAPTAGTAHIQEARHLVLYGFLHPSAEGQPLYNDPDTDLTCHTRGDSFDNSPAGVCIDRCNPMANEGGAARELESTTSGMAFSRACPFSDLPTSPNNPACTPALNPVCTTTQPPNQAFGESCLISSSAACGAMFGTVAPAGGGPFCGDGTVDVFPSPLPADPALWQRIEQCDNGNPATPGVNINAPLVNPVSGQPLRCSELGDLLGPARAPNPPLSGGLVHCQTNCFLDLSRCTRPFLDPDLEPGSDGILTLVEARKQSTTHAFAEVYDAKGKVKAEAKPALLPADGEKLNLREMGPSNHGVFTFLRRVMRQRQNPMNVAWPASASDHRYREVWQLIVGMDEAEFLGDGFGGRMREIRRFELEFDLDYVANTSTLLSVNGRACTDVGTRCTGADENEWPQVFLGFAANPAVDPYVGPVPCRFGAQCSQPQAATGPFQREVCKNDGTCTSIEPSPAEVTLRLDLRNLFVQLAKSPINQTIYGPRQATREAFGGVFSSYARNNVQTVMGQPLEIQQYGAQRYQRPQWTDDCAANPMSPCCYMCDAPPMPIPAACLDAFGRDDCQTFDRQSRFDDIFTFNASSQRHDTSEATLEMLHRQFFGSRARVGFPDVTPPTNVMEEQALEMSVLANPNGPITSDWETLSNVMKQRWGITIPAAKLPSVGVNIDPGFGAAACPDVLIDPLPGGAVDVNQDLQVVFVLDHSGSMGVEDTTAMEEPRSRLDYVKIAAHNFLDDMLAKTQRDGGSLGPKVGLVWYSDRADVRAPQLTATTCTLDSNCPLSQSCIPRGGSQKGCTVNANCGSGETCINQTCAIAAQSVCAEPMRFLSDSTSMQAVDIDNFKSQMVLSGEGIAETPEPGGPEGGFTGTGAAIGVATHMFNPGRTTPAGVQPPTKIIMLLSDGLHNRPKGGVCLGSTFCTQVSGSTCLIGTCGTSGQEPCGVDAREPMSGQLYGNLPGCWPTSDADRRYSDALTTAQAQNIQIYSVPLANEGDKAGAAIRAGQTQGEVFEANRNFGEDTIPVFMQARAATEGQQLSRTHLSLPYVELFETEEFGFFPGIVWDIRVEPTARTLDVRVSDYDALQDDFDLNQVQLESPSGVSYPLAEGQPGVEISRLSGAIRIDTPEPGVWRLVDYAPRIGGTPAAPQYFMRFYTAAHVDGPGRECVAAPSIRIATATTPIHVSAEAVFERPIVSGVTYTGTLLRPDQTMVALDFERDPSSGRTIATVPPSALVGRGNYVVNVRCDVAAGAQLALGERTPDRPDPSPGPSFVPDAFTRESASSFYFDSDTAPPVPGLDGNDQDPAVLDSLATRDCPPALLAANRCFIPTTFAPVVPFLNDADGDGIPNSAEPAADVDTDGDGQPDVFDSDANGNEQPDGDDPCLDDNQAPVVSATAHASNQCSAVPREITLTATGSDNCSAPGELAFTATVVTIKGHAVSIPASVTGTSAVVTLPPGTSVVRWSARDAAGNVSATVDQTVTVTAQDNVAACCQSGMTVVQGTGFPDFIARPLTGQYCIFGAGSIDTIVTGPGADYQSGGTSGDRLTGGAAGDWLVGGDGEDWIRAPFASATILGGANDDVIEETRGGDLYGGAGNDSINTDFVAHRIFPGPGRDTVRGGVGDDTVVIRHVCELSTFELLNGGLGNDTLITPVPVSELVSRGVILVGFENVIVKSDEQHLSECY